MKAIFSGIVFVLSCIHLSDAFVGCGLETEKLKKKVAVLEAKAKGLLSVYIKSEGCNDPGIVGCGHAFIRVNGIEHSKKGRGYNVVVVNGKTGVVESSKRFDTHGSSKATKELTKHLNNIKPRKIVLVAIQDEGHARMSNNAFKALIRLGAVNPLRGTFRSSFALLGYSGPGKLDAVAQVQRPRHKGPSIISKVVSLPI